MNISIPKLITAFPVWDNRIAPVFDTAKDIVVVETENGRVIAENTYVLPEESAAKKILKLAELRVDVLVCGAISRELCDAIESQGVQVVAFVAGDLQELISAWKNNKLCYANYAMPGCRRRQRSRCRRRVRNRNCLRDKNL